MVSSFADRRIALPPHSPSRPVVDLDGDKLGAAGGTAGATTASSSTTPASSAVRRAGLGIVDDLVLASRRTAAARRRQRRPLALFAVRIRRHTTAPTERAQPFVE